MIKLKHWVLFLLLLGPALMASIISRPNELSQSEISASIIMVVLYFGWLWSVYNHVSSQAQRKKDVLFLIIFTLVFMYFISFNLLLLLGRIAEDADVGIYNLAALVSVVACLVVISKRLKSIELNESASLDRYLLYVVLFFAFPIGVWILQPKINKLA